MNLTLTVYLWVLHVGGLLLGFALGLEAERGTWAAALVCGAISAAAMCCLIALHMERNRKP